MQTLFDHLFVPASCAMLNISATKTGVLWGKCYTSSFLAMPCDSAFMYCTCNGKQAPCMDEFQGYRRSLQRNQSYNQQQECKSP